jgi:hypothetical protein
MRSHRPAPAWSGAAFRARRITVRVHQRLLHDAGDAARPPDDAIFVELVVPGVLVRTETRILGRGDRHEFHLTAGDLMDLGDPAAPPRFPATVRVRLIDHRAAGRGDGDALADVAWVAPYHREAFATRHGYDLEIGFEG